jgi:hypothetical protein
MAGITGFRQPYRIKVEGTIIAAGRKYFTCLFAVSGTESGFAIANVSWLNMPMIKLKKERLTRLFRLFLDIIGLTGG